MQRPSSPGSCPGFADLLQQQRDATSGGRREPENNFAQASSGGRRKRGVCPGFGISLAPPLRVMYPWAGMETSVVIGPPPHLFPVLVSMPSGAAPMHPQLQAYPFFQNQISGTIPNPCTPYMAYAQPCHPPTDQPSNQFNTPVPHSSSYRSQSPAQDCRSKSSTLQQASCGGRSDDFGDVATDLELKTPRSSAPSHSELANKDSSSDLKKKKQCIKQINGSTLTEGSSSSRCSSSGPPDVSNSVGDGSVADDHDRQYKHRQV